MSNYTTAKNYFVHPKIGKMLMEKLTADNTSKNTLCDNRSKRHIGRVSSIERYNIIYAKKLEKKLNKLVTKKKIFL